MWRIWPILPANLRNSSCSAKPIFPDLWSQAEWEALEIVTHEWSLENVEEEMMADYSPTDPIEDLAKDKYV